MTAPNSQRIPVIAAGLGTLTFALIVNQFLLRFVLPTDFFGALTPAAISAHDAQVFSARWPLLIAYLAAVAVVLITGPTLLADAAQLRSRYRRYSLACGASAVLGAAMGWCFGIESLGGYALVSYWCGLGALWLVGLAVAEIARYRGAWDVVRDWAVISYGIALAPLLWFTSVPLWLVAADMTLTDAYVTGAILGFATNFLVAHFVNVEILGALA